MQLINHFSMNKAFSVIIVALTAIVVTSSCAVLTQSQVGLVNELTLASDSVAIAPSQIFEQLFEIRKERGLYFAASLGSADARFEEINAIAESASDDSGILKRIDVYVSVLNSYLRALRSISNDARWENTGREIRGVGRNIDSLIFTYNKLYPDYPVETGTSKQVGKSAAYIVEELTKRRQAVIVKEFVTQGDTLVSACCDELMSLLKKQEVNELILNEESGLEANYRAYLNAIELSGTFPSIENDRRYLVLKQEIYDTKKMKNKCVSSLRSLKKAHSKLLMELSERKKIDQVYEEILELNQQALELSELFNR